MKKQIAILPFKATIGDIVKYRNSHYVIYHVESVPVPDKSKKFKQRIMVLAFCITPKSGSVSDRVVIFQDDQPSCNEVEVVSPAWRWEE